jgi:uracil-DNA glycosylase family 4
MEDALAGQGYDADSAIGRIEARVIACRRCPELRAYIDRVAAEKKRAHRHESYWGKPVPAFGDPAARVALVGLAPGAHGSNRTGRMFTGDASGEWLFRAMHKAGFASQAFQRDKSDGLTLHDAFITAAARCAPPGNKPTPRELANCAPFLHAELAELGRLRVVIGLGAIGTKAAYDALRALGYAFDGALRFAHLAEAAAKAPDGARAVTLLASYHPSRQNTNTGVLTEAMLDAVFERARELCGETSAPLQR